MNMFLTYYSNNQCKEKRNIALSSVNKVEYILKKIINETPITVLSASNSLEGISKKSIIKTNCGVPVILPFSMGKKNLINKIIDRFIIKAQLLWWLIFKLKSKDTLIVYHSLGYMKIVSFAKKIKKFKLIIEVEEIYGDVLNNNYTIKKELNFFKLADSYIFPTELLNKKINVKNKPYVIIHGTYNVEPKLVNKFNDGKFHCVYAGTFDSRKSGCIASVTSSLYLNEKYHIHIIGFGTKEDTEKIIKSIEGISNKTKCKVTYDGCFSGEEYLKFIQKCDIGLSTQNPIAKFNDTSFPSKILSYMANGLRVVSVMIPVVETSSIGKYLYYYYEQSPEKIAEAIKKVNFNDEYDSRKIISELDIKFQRELKSIIG